MSNGERMSAGDGGVLTQTSKHLLGEMGSPWD